MTVKKISSLSRLPPVVVISLVDSESWRDWMTSQLASAGVPFRFFDAERLTAYPEDYDAQTRLRNYGNHLTMGELGCYDSHMQVWRQLAETNDDVWCVLEDDIDVSPDFAQRVVAALNAPLPWGIMRLVNVNDYRGWCVATMGEGQRLDAYAKQPKGAQGYLIRRSAALVLLAYGLPMVHPVDDMMNRTWEHGIGMLCLRPDVIKHQEEVHTTTIPGRQKAKRSLLQKLWREFHTGCDSFWRNLDALRVRQRFPAIRKVRS